MKVLRARNVHQALPLGVQWLQDQGLPRPSRGGPVVEALTPVATEYARPQERVLFWPQRDANPFFHLAEALWMLAGRQDLTTIVAYNKRMAQYSDDGEVLHGAYGYRWRSAFKMDQLAELVAVLKADPSSRRAVLQMWHAPKDLGILSKDIPCNLTIAFKLLDGALRMTVFCRSNDIVWGAYGTNAVHFSMLQEYLADALHVAVGTYTQISDSFHAYAGVWEKVHGLPVGEPCPYATGEVRPYPLKAGSVEWDADLAAFFRDPDPLYVTPYFHDVVRPLFQAYAAHKAGEPVRALRWLYQCAASDWAKAATEWIQRRHPVHKEVPS